MATNARLGIDIVGTDRTRAAFMSAQRSMQSFARTAKTVASFFGGAAIGALLRRFSSSIFEVNKNLAPVKNSFTQMDRAWQQFALNVGKAGVNEAMMRFNHTMSQMVVGMNSLSEAVGSFLSGAIDGLRVGLEAAGRAAAFLYDNLGDIGSLGSRVGKALGTTGFAESLGMTSKNFNQDAINGLKAMGLETKSLTVDLNTFNGAIKALPPTFKETADSTKKSDDAMEKLRDTAQRMWKETWTPLEKYQAGLRELNVLQAQGVLIQDTYSRQLEKLKAEFLDTGKEAKDLGDTFGDTFGDSLKGMFDDALNGTFKLKDALTGLIKSLATAGLNKFLDAGGGGGNILGSLLGSFMGKSYGGLYANGGTLGAGKWGIAGENGPEPIVGPATVIPNRGSAVKLTIVNNNGSQITTREKTDARGNREIIAMVDQRIAQQTADPYSRTSSSLNARGARPPLKQR